MTKEMKRMFEKADSLDSDEGEAMSSSESEAEEPDRSNNPYECKRISKGR